MSITKRPWYPIDGYPGLTASPAGEEYSGAVVWHGYDGQAPSKEDLAHIIKCVNNHDALLAQLDDLVYQVETTITSGECTCSAIDTGDAQAVIDKCKEE
jgi:hypothetical protein